MTPTPRKLGDIRKARTPATQPPPGGIPAALAGAVGQFPMMPGTVKLTEMEKNVLKKHGWKEGDPIPQSLPNLYAATQAAQASADEMPDIATGEENFQVSMPAEQKFADLPAAKKGELAQALRDAKIQGEMFQRRQSSQIEDAGPGLNAAIDVAMSAPQTPASAVIVDDLSPQTVAAPPQSKPIPPTDKDLDAAPGAGGAVAPTHCKNCGHEYGREIEVEATDEDKLRWLVAQESGQRFTKTYNLLGGRVVVTFRTLTSKESDMAWRQVAVDGSRDLRSNTIETEDSYWRNLMTYRMVLGVARLWTPTQGPQENPELDDWQVDREDYPAPNTKVYALLPAVTQALFPSENLRRQVGNAFHLFQLLAGHLEANAMNDVFWNGIESQS
jgi:hypothetical protein